MRGVFDSAGIKFERPPAGAAYARPCWWPLSCALPPAGTAFLILAQRNTAQEGKGHPSAREDLSVFDLVVGRNGVDLGTVPVFDVALHAAPMAPRREKPNPWRYETGDYDWKV